MHAITTDKTIQLNNNQQKPIVGIIGGGVSGILCIRHLQDIAEIKCFEGNSVFGGTWSYQKQPDEFYNECCIENYGTTYSSVYEDLITNHPRLFLALKDFVPQKYLDQTYWSFEAYHQYLEDYVKQFDLLKYIQFNTFVEKILTVAKLTEKEREINNISAGCTQKYLMKLKTHKGIKTQLVDYVLVCNGHFAVPSIPDFKNQNEFEGEIVHSHSFRKKTIQKFQNKKIVLLGTGPSSFDIINFLLNSKEGQPEKIYLAIRKPNIEYERTSFFSEWIKSGKFEVLNKTIEKLGKNKTVTFTDDTSIEDVSFILCSTGYSYSFPFFEDNLIQFLPENTQNQAFGPIYKRMFCVNDPNIILIGHTQFNTFHEKQAIVAKSYIQGKLQLPEKSEMLQEFQNDVKYSQSLSQNLRALQYSHGLIEREGLVKYHNELAELLKVPKEQQDIKYLEYLQECVQEIEVYMKKGDYLLIRKNNVFKELVSSHYEQFYCNTYF